MDVKNQTSVLLIKIKNKYLLLKKNFNKLPVQYVKKFKRQILKYGNMDEHFQAIKLFISTVFQIGFVKIARLN